MNDKASTQKLFFSFRAFFWFLAVLIILQLAVGIYAYDLIEQTHEGSPDINIVGSLRMLVQRINGSTVTIASDMHSLDTWDQLQRDVQRANHIIQGLRYGDPSLRLVPLKGERQLDLLHTLEIEWPQYIQNIEALIVQDPQMTPEEKQLLIQQLSSQANYMVLTIDELTLLEQNRSKSSLQVLTLIFLTVGIVSTILIIIFWYRFLHQGFIRPLSTLLPALEAVMKGDTKQRVPEEGTHTTRKIAANYNQLATNLQSTYIDISRNLSSVLVINNKLIYLTRKLSKTVTENNEQLLDANSTEEQLKTKQDMLSQTNEIMILLTRQSIYAEELRDKQVFLESSLCDKEMMELLMTDIEMRRQRAYLYSMGHGEPKHIGDCRLDTWIGQRGEKLFSDYPRFKSLTEHHHSFHQALADVIDTVANNETEHLQEKLSRVDTFAELCIIDLQQLKAACQ